ncbi:myrosinase 1-like [Leguminivora glycinivorella]|uniref:myrosinase 1-like n=1 Tax=Leguminivora glycinivorella TaxID=1035111 RepID=UPI0020102756|nr:myrosinase 1-like [Leguminivora glycinivorella]
MTWMQAVIICAAVCVAAAERRFPEGFKFGAATASYQVEGAWNVSDKGENIWDRFVHSRPEAISDRSTGDVACDSYHRWQEDIQLLVDMNVDFYRFSISWSRLLPTGFSQRVSADGARYYGDLIDGLLAKGIEPIVTLYHWDLPQPLQDLGGWANPMISDWFADYARVAYNLYGDRVKTWVTINEPTVICDIGYNNLIAPGLESEGRGSYLCTKHVLLAHAKAYRLYERDFKPKYQGQVSLTNHMMWFEPATEQDVELTELVKTLSIQRYCHPIFSSEGGWPPALERYIAEKSREEGEPRSRLPPFTQEEKEMLRGSYDYLGLNHYTTRTVRPAAPGEHIGTHLFDGFKELGVVLGAKPEWPTTMSHWFMVHPEGLRALLVSMKQQYGDVPIFIMENGLSDTGADLDDQPRVDYYRSYLEQVLLAIEDGVRVVGYTAWSLLDNFEWMDGYQSRYGLHHVDFSSELRTRTARRSARYYAAVARTKDIHAQYQFNKTNTVKGV